MAVLLKNKKIGYGITGSFCTFKKMIEAIKDLDREEAEIYPVMSEISYSTDTRFGKAEDFRNMLIDITGNTIIKSVKEAEPVGPKKMFDLMIVAPCTGNTLAKIANGITDTSVTMAVKAHIRNGRPVLLGVSTNDALGNSARNIGALLNYKNIYFVPFEQDDYLGKPNSLVASFNEIIPAAEAALDGIQLQPLLLRRAVES